MPYHVVVSRQVLLDGLMTLCATLALYCVARYVETGAAELAARRRRHDGRRDAWPRRRAWSCSAALYAFFALTPAGAAAAQAPLAGRAADRDRSCRLPVVLRLPGAAATGQNYLLWQLFRRPNHANLVLLPRVLPAGSGSPCWPSPLAGLVWLRREATWRERLLLAWIVVPVLFFTLWPVKGFQYLLPVAPALAVLAGRDAGRRCRRRAALRRGRRLRRPRSALA